MTQNVASFADRHLNDENLSMIVDEIRKSFQQSPGSSLKVDLSGNYFSKTSVKEIETLLTEYPKLSLDLSVNNLSFNDFSTDTADVLRYYPYYIEFAKYIHY